MCLLRRVVSLQTDKESLPQKACFAFVSCICRKPLPILVINSLPSFFSTKRLKSQRDEAIASRQIAVFAYFSTCGQCCCATSRHRREVYVGVGQGVRYCDIPQ